MPGRAFESGPDLRVRASTQGQDGFAAYMILGVLEECTERGKDLPAADLAQKPESSKAPTERHACFCSRWEGERQPLCCPDKGRDCSLSYCLQSFFTARLREKILINKANNQ